MKNRHRVVWTQGMFLTPQHFQAQEQFFEEALDFRFNASNYANWGVTELEIDEKLTNGFFRVDRCSGLMPDGEPIDIPGADEAPPSRTVTEHFPPNRESLDVYLALPEKRAGARMVTISGAEEPPRTRYVAELQMRNDENLGNEEKEIQVARRTFRFLFEDEYRGGFTALRIAQIIRSPAGTPIVNPKFVTPCLNLASSAYLSGLLLRQIEILATKSSALSAQGRQGSLSPSELMDFWLLQTVNSYIPELKHIWKTRRGHPEPAYIAMLRLAGALSVFSKDARAENLPDYDHNDLGNCFTLLDQKIHELMGYFIKEKYVGVRLEPSDRFIWSGTVTEDAYFRDTQFYLSVSAKMGVDDLIRKVQAFVKVTSQEDVQRIVRNALPGLTLRHAPAPPSALKIQADHQYFHINQSGPLWDTLVKSRKVAVFAPGEIVEPKMELLIVLE